VSAPLSRFHRKKKRTHYRRLTVRQSFDVENTLSEQDNIIDFPVAFRDLKRYDEVIP